MLYVQLRKTVIGIESVGRVLKSCHPFLVSSILKKYGASIGSAINFKGFYTFDNITGDEDSKGDFSNLQIGDRCVIGKEVFFDLTNSILIGNEVGIGSRSMLMTHIDLGRMPMSRVYPRESKFIKIGDGCFLGAQVIILHGVELGKGCVVAAGSLVKDSFPDYSLIAGVPAKLMKKLNEG